MAKYDNSPLVQRFLKYVAIDTQSVEDRAQCPSTKGQLELAKIVMEDMEKIGLTEIEIDDNGYIMGTLPSNDGDAHDTIGLVAHLDTAPNFSGKDVKPQFVYDYDGKDIVLNEKEGIVLKVKDFPELKNYVGGDIITTDGTTLLGADNKAGIASILGAMRYLTKNPQIKHGKIRVAFTPDEEIGEGATLFDVKKFGAKYAYTIDGGEIGELEYENFNAATAKIQIQGVEIHPGAAKNKMVNSLLLGMELQGMLPVEQRPEFTTLREGFFLLNKMSGDVDSTSMTMIIREHDMQKFEAQKEVLKNAGEFINKKYGYEAVKIEIKDSYYNMREKVEPHMHIIERAKKAMKEAGVTPLIKPVRGGTDGARLSYMGLPCPNVFTGGHNFHGRFEFLPIQSLELSAQTVINICKA